MMIENNAASKFEVVGSPELKLNLFVCTWPDSKEAESHSPQPTVVRPALSVDTSCFSVPDIGNAFSSTEYSIPSSNFSTTASHQWAQHSSDCRCESLYTKAWLEGSELWKAVRLTIQK